MLGRFSRFLGRFKALFLPFGLFALLAIGLHAGGDRADDYCFIILNFIDSLVDDAFTAVIRFVWDLFGASKASTGGAIYWAVDLVDVDLKGKAARVMALIIELAADVLFALPIFLNRGKDISARDLLRNTFKDPTVLRFVAPLAAALASVAGVIIIAREMQVAMHSVLTSVGLNVHQAGNAAGVIGLIALLLVTWRLGSVVTLAAARWAELRAREDTDCERSKRKRRTRGLITALFAMPLSFVAVIEGTQIISAIKALLPM